MAWTGLLVRPAWNRRVTGVPPEGRHPCIKRSTPVCHRRSVRRPLRSRHRRLLQPPARGAADGLRRMTSRTGRAARPRVTTSGGEDVPQPE